jgi:hypothetical protein
MCESEKFTEVTIYNPAARIRTFAFVIKKLRILLIIYLCAPREYSIYSLWITGWNTLHNTHIWFSFQRLKLVCTLKSGLKPNTLCRGYEKVIHSAVYDWSCHRKSPCRCLRKFPYKLFVTWICVVQDTVYFQTVINCGLLLCRQLSSLSDNGRLCSVRWQFIRPSFTFITCFSFVFYTGIQLQTLLHSYWFTAIQYP